MGRTRDPNIPDNIYEKRRAYYLKNRDKQLASAKIRYAGEKEIRRKIAGIMREAGRQKRLQEKRLAFYKDKHVYTRNSSVSYVKEFKESNPCVDCGSFYPYYVMDLDHVRGEKVAGMSVLAFRHTSHAKILEEMAKCDLVCANCHRKRSFSRKQHLS